MRVNIRDDKCIVLDQMPKTGEFIFAPDEAVRFAKVVMDAAARCGFREVIAETMAPRKLSAEKTMMLYQRAALIMRSQLDSGRTPAQAATHVVDRVLQEVL